jgi:hypothetical protein
LWRRENLVYLALLAAVGVSLYSHSLVFKEFIMPTYGNTMVHAASIRNVIETGDYPMQDYSYGGTARNLYVPIYRMAVACIVLLTGFSIDLASRLFVSLIAVILPLAFYALGERIFPKSGLFAAFFVSLPAEYLIYTVRPLPQAFGLALLPIAFAAILGGEKKLAALLSLAIALVHQEAAVFLAVGAFAFAIAESFFFAVGGKKSDQSERVAVSAALSWFACTFGYLGWHYFIMGNFNFWELAQFKYHEGAPLLLDSAFQKTGFVVTALSAIGLLFACVKFAFPGKEEESGNGIQAVFLLSLLAVSIAFVKNDAISEFFKPLLGFTIHAFMDRFLVYLQIPLVLLAGLGAVALWDLLGEFGKWFEALGG